MGYLNDRLKRFYYKNKDFLRKRNVLEGDLEKINVDDFVEDPKQEQIEELYRTIGNQNTFDKYSKKDSEIDYEDVYVLC